MKAFTLAVIVAIFAGCGEKKPPQPKEPPQLMSANDLKPPENAPPPVETQPYEDGFRDGQNAGELAAKNRPAHTKRKQPEQNELEVLALEAAGANPDRGAKWQRGYVSGYRDGFERITTGRR